MSACRQATAGAGVIRAEVIDGAKLTRFTKWGRKYLPDGAESTCLMGPKVLAWNGLGGYSFPRFIPSGSCTFSDRKTRNPEDFHKDIAAGS